MRLKIAKKNNNFPRPKLLDLCNRNHEYVLRLRTVLPLDVSKRATCHAVCTATAYVSGMSRSLAQQPVLAVVIVLGRAPRQLTLQ